MATPKPRARNVADLKANILRPSLTSTYECHFNPPPAVRSWMNRRRGFDIGSGYNYRVNFPNEYKSEIFIRKFERDYKGRDLQYKFVNAYPISINQMPINYDASQILLCTVNFNFSRYIISGER